MPWLVSVIGFFIAPNFMVFRLEIPGCRYVASGLLAVRPEFKPAGLERRVSRVDWMEKSYRRWWPVAEWRRRRVGVWVRFSHARAATRAATM